MELKIGTNGHDLTGLLGILQKLQTVKHKKKRSSRPEVFLRKGVLIICSKFTGEHPCRIVISIKLLRYKVSIKLQSNFIEIALRYGCSPVNLLHTFRTNFSRNISRWLLLKKDFFVIFWSSFLP